MHKKICNVSHDENTKKGIADYTAFPQAVIIRTKKGDTNLKTVVSPHAAISKQKEGVVSSYTALINHRKKIQKKFLCLKIVSFGFGNS